MIVVPSWVVLNFFTSFLLILLLIFQSSTSRVKQGRKYSAVLVCTLLLLISDSIGRIALLRPDEFILFARIGYYLTFLLDPVDVLLAVKYVDCWMDDGNQKKRGIYRAIFGAFAIVNGIAVIVSLIFRLRWFCYFENGVYHRGEYFMVRAVALMIFIIILLVYTVRFRSNFISEYKNPILFLPIFSLMGGLLQVFFAEMDTTYAGVSLGCLVLFCFFQSKDVNVDYLTGILNRRGLDIKMQEKVRQAIYSGENFSAIMLDIDNFKSINDQFGHAAGDKAIKSMANILVDIFGANDDIGRFGGDEFCVISDEVSDAKNKNKITRVHDEIAKLRNKNGWPENVDVSCGYCVYDYQSGMSSEEFQKIIDKLMYDEKQIHHSVFSTEQ